MFQSHRRTQGKKNKKKTIKPTNPAIYASETNEGESITSPLPVVCFDLISDSNSYYSFFLSDKRISILSFTAFSFFFILTIK